MPSSRAKGRRNELRAKALLESWGWEVYLVPPQQRFGQADIFGLWDLVAVKNGEVLWAQVKTNRKPGKSYMDRLRAFKAPIKWLILFKDRIKNPLVITI